MLTDEARTLTITDATTGKSGLLPDTVAQLTNDYMFVSGQVKLASNLTPMMKGHITGNYTEQVGDVIARYNKAAYALHGMIEYLRVNKYLDDGLAKKLSDSENSRQLIDANLTEARKEITRLRSLVRLLGGNPDKTDDSMIGSVEP